MLFCDVVYPRHNFVITFETRQVNCTFHNTSFLMINIYRKWIVA
jgi:hypothetical protein